MKGIFETKKDKTISIEEQVEPNENKGGKVKKHQTDGKNDVVTEAASMGIGLQIIHGL